MLLNELDDWVMNEKTLQRMIQKNGQYDGCMTDDVMEKLGSYYVYNQILERYGVPFERFVYIFSRDYWNEYIGNIS